MNEIEEKIQAIYNELKDVHERNELSPDKMEGDVVLSTELTQLAASQVAAELKVAKLIAADVFGPEYREVDVWSILDTILKVKLQTVFMIAGKEKAKSGKPADSLTDIIKSLGGTKGSGGGGGNFPGFNNVRKVSNYFM